MAVRCARCGTENPDGNAFCTSCGAPLVAAPPPGGIPVPPGSMPVAPTPTAAVAPVTPPPPAYVPGQSVYLPPPPVGTAPVHRTSQNAVIAIVVVVLLLIAGAVVAFAALHKGSQTTIPPTPPGNSFPTSRPTSAPSAQPTFRPTQQPTAAPSSAPTSSPGGGGSSQTLDTPFATVFVPAGFSPSDQKSDYVVLTPGSNNGLVIVQSDPLPSGSTNAALDQALLQSDQMNYDPSAKFCDSSAPKQVTLTGSGGPVAADIIAICETVTPQNGTAFAAVDAYVAGVAKAADGSLKSVIINIFASHTNYSSFSSSLPNELFTMTVFKDAAPAS